MFFITHFLTLFTLAQAAVPAVTPNVKTELVTQLSKYEPFHEAVLFHDGLLWVGRSRVGLASAFFLEVYSSDGKLLGRTGLIHSLRHFYANGKQSITVTGIKAEPYESYLTTATWNGKEITQTVTKTSGDGEHLAEEFAQGPDVQVFTDPGGDCEGVALGTPCRTLYTLDNKGGTHTLPLQFSFPKQPVFIGGFLFATEIRETTAHTSAVRVNLATGEIARIFSQSRRDLQRMLYLPLSERLALSERAANQALLVNPQTRVLESTITEGLVAPKGVAEFGKCLVISSEDIRHLTFYDMKKGNRLVATWDLSPIFQHLMKAQEIVADFASGTVYARSSVACNPKIACPEERNGVVLARDLTGQTKAQCNP